MSSFDISDDVTPTPNTVSITDGNTLLFESSPTVESLVTPANKKVSFSIPNNAITPDQVAGLHATNPGYIATSGSAFFTSRNNWAATTNPGTSNDSSQGYAVGSRWVNTVQRREWVCVDNSSGAAVWREITIAPTRIRLWHDNATIVSGSAITAFTNTSQLYNNVALQVPSAGMAGDSFSQTFTLAAGTYTLRVLGETRPERGIIKWALDGADIVTGQDWYSAALTNNVLKTNSGINVTYSGAHTLSATVTGRHGSATEWLIALTYYEFIKE